MKEIKPGTVLAIFTIIASLFTTYGMITNRIDVLEEGQITKEDIREIVRDNNTDLLRIIDTKIALAVEKKNNE